MAKVEDFRVETRYGHWKGEASENAIFSPYGPTDIRNPPKLKPDRSYPPQNEFVNRQSYLLNVSGIEPNMPTLDGQDDALNELIVAKKWKQALNLCEKKLKKSNNGDYLLVCDPLSSMTDYLGPSCSNKHRSKRFMYCFCGQKRHAISRDGRSSASFWKESPQ